MDYDSLETYYIGRIVGSVIGTVVGLVILIIIAVCIRKRHNQEMVQQQQQQQQVYYQYPPGQQPPNMQVAPGQGASSVPVQQMQAPMQQMVAIPIPAGSAQLPQQPPQPGYYYAVLQPPQQAATPTASTPNSPVPQYQEQLHQQQLQQPQMGTSSNSPGSAKQQV
ncbi:hypothetical protein BDC45DRAFT_572206 [Circinella umbellata]|nr:hypothetical protein BDC45DRAFT_572206 [Circinella umbellata]